MSTESGIRVAIVTGASSGIGRAAAIRIAERGAGVIVTYNSDPDGARETVEAIERAGGSAVALRLDVGRSETFADFAEQAAAEAGRRWGRTTFDSLVNNAGFGQPALLGHTTEELWDRFHRVLLKGPYFLTQTLLPRLADGGAIVNTTSASALPSGRTAGYSAYAIMKGGAVVMTEYMAKELAPRRIRVNAVAPGPTRSKMTDDAFATMPDLIQALVDRTALGRFGESDDVGRVIAALVSDEFSWVTAQHIEVSGGFNL